MDQTAEWIKWLHFEVRLDIEAVNEAWKFYESHPNDDNRVTLSSHVHKLLYDLQLLHQHTVSQ